MTQMVTNGENKDKPYDEISELLRKHYKPNKEQSQEEFWQKIVKKIDSLFHRELLSEKLFDNDGNPISNEDRYWKGLEEYINNELSSLKHKVVTEHLLNCKECRHSYNEMLSKKKEAMNNDFNSKEFVFV